MYIAPAILILIGVFIMFGGLNRPVVYVQSRPCRNDLTQDERIELMYQKRDEWLAQKEAEREANIAAEKNMRRGVLVIFAVISLVSVAVVIIHNVG